MCWYGRKDNNTGILANLTDGGDNTYGIVMTEEHKRKICATGRKHSESTKQKIAEAQIGAKNHMYGKTPSDETINKMKQSQAGDKNHFHGKTHSIETRQKLSEISKGKTPSIETRQKLSDATKGIKHEIIGCPHCSMIGGKSAMKRWHFDNCKSIQQSHLVPQMESIYHSISS